MFSVCNDGNNILCEFLYKSISGKIIQTKKFRTFSAFRELIDNKQRSIIIFSERTGLTKINLIQKFLETRYL